MGGWDWDGDQNPHAEQEQRNTLCQMDRVLRMIEEHSPDAPLVISSALICELNSLAMHGIVPSPGSYRPDGESFITGSHHIPPPCEKIPALIEDFCSQTNQLIADRDPFEASAYVFWRLVWIHPFVDGNGRTSRALGYLVLSVLLGVDIDGKETLLEKLQEYHTKKRYYECLRKADWAWKTQRKVNVSEMNMLLQEVCETLLEERLFDL